MLSSSAPIPCVGAVAVSSERLLLVLRGRPPGEGRWSIPGGRVEAGESEAEAVAREMAEETGLRVAVGQALGSVLRDAPGGSVYQIRDYQVEVVGGELRAGDDAADVRWVPIDQLNNYPLVDGLLDSLHEWGALPQSPSQPPPQPPPQSPRS